MYLFDIDKNLVALNYNFNFSRNYFRNLTNRSHRIVRDIQTFVYPVGVQTDHGTIKGRKFLFADHSISGAIYGEEKYSGHNFDPERHIIITSTVRRCNDLRPPG